MSLIDQLVKDSRHKELLESRLAGFSPSSPPPPGSAFSAVNNGLKEDKDSGSVATLLDSIASPPRLPDAEEASQPKPTEDSQPHSAPLPAAEMPPAAPHTITVEQEVILLDDSGSQSRSLPSPKLSFDGAELPGAHVVGIKRMRSEDDSRSHITHDSIEGSLDRAHRLKTTDDEHNSPTPPPDSGSRGATVHKTRTIISYFAQSDGTGVFPSTAQTDSSAAVATNSAAAGGSASAAPAAAKSGSSVSGAVKKKEKDSKERDKEKEKEKEAVSSSSALSAISELKKQLDAAKQAKDQAELKAQRFEADVKVYQDKSTRAEERSNRVSKALEDVHRLMAMQEFRRKRDRLALDCVRLGKITSVRTSATAIGEVWEDGYAWKELNKRSAELLERKEELETRRRKVTNMKRQAKKASSDDLEVEIEADLDLATEQEAVRFHLEQLKKDEIALAEERRLLESEKAIHQKELRRCQCEERSRFYRDLPCLNGRYLLQHMLGRGGFSEVWKALDLQELREVAVKVHQLNPQWSEERKQSYIRHVTREYNIHKDMKHPRVVQLFDVFEIDMNSFATVLEYCKGIDLDEKLKRQRCINEKDARVIIMQIMSGLRYLHKPYGDDSTNRKISIIHFDLKPANILFDEMEDVKITDFGLSKIIDESNEGTSMELTSQGAGTYWYLPPECFAKGPNPPRISSKVDVWSVGIIFFQMLYGCRPYGEGKTQENVWSENIIYNAASVEFPSDPKAPKVSDEAKDLIRACLTRDQRLRPDVLAVCQHPYLKNK